MNGDFVVNHSLRKGSGLQVDQALEKEYNKPAKGPSGIIGFTRRKEAVLKWDLIKHEKTKYRKFLYSTCFMNEYDEYNLHHEFSPTITETDIKSVSLIKEYILQRGNPFNLDKPQPFINITSGAAVEKEECEFLLNCMQLGEAARDDFYESRRSEKSVKLFDVIPKTKNQKKKPTTVTTYE